MRVRDLGPIEFELDGEVAAPGGLLAQTLLALLASRQPAAVPNDEIGAALWGEPLPERMDARIEQHVWRLRSRLAGPDRQPGPLLREGDGYALRLAPDALDSSRFERLVEAARAALGDGRPDDALRLADEALALWRGEPYEQLTDHWARGRAAGLRERRREAKLLAADAVLACGEAREAARRTRQLLEADPLDEPVWERRILALYLAGRQASALAAYDEVRRILDAELGVPPGPSLRALHLRILRQDPSLVPPPSGRGHNAALPAWLTSFVGRDADLAGLVSLLDRVRLVSVVGPGGVGKTRLAVRAAGRVGAAKPDGCCFVDLAAVEDPSAVAAAVVLALRAAGTMDPAVEAAALALARRRMLLVLDNCEHVGQSAAALVARLLAAAPGLTVLATSREPLRLAGERIWQLEPLTAAEAELLFAERVEETWPQAGPLSDDDRGQAARICEAVDGLPLAVELAAARVRVLGVLGVADRLERGLDVLKGGADRPARHRTLHAAIEWSHRQAAPNEQIAFRRLAAVPAAMSLRAACRMAGHPPLLEEDVPDLLASLVDRSLVQSDRVAGGARYRLLVPVRRYAEALLGPAERTACMSALVAHLIDLAAQRPVVGTIEYPAWMPAAEADVAIVEPALDWAFGEGGRPADGARILGPFTLFFTSTMRGVVPRRWLPRALADLPPGHPLHARLMAEHGLLLLSGGTAEPGSERARAGIKALVAAGERGTAAELAAQLAMRLVFWVGDADLAERWLDAADLPIDEPLPGVTAALRASVAAMRGQDEQVRRWLPGAAGSMVAEGIALMAAAGLAERAGRFADAEGQVWASLDLWVAMGSRSEYRHLARLARLRLAQGDTEGAVRLAAAAERNVRSLGDGSDAAFHASLVPLLDDAALRIGSAAVGAAWGSSFDAPLDRTIQEVLGAARRLGRQPVGDPLVSSS